MEDPLSQGVSPISDNYATNCDLSSSVTSDDKLLDISNRHTLNVLRTPVTKKAKRVRFFRNGDKFYTGVVMAVTPERYRSFDSLASDLTRALVSSVTLPNGVRSIYSMDGKRVSTISDLEDGKSYVVSGQGETFKKVEYSSSKVRRGSSLSGLPQSPAGTGRQINPIPACVKPRIITLIRHGTKPRRIVRLLLNKRNAPSLEHALEAITEAVKLDSGAVRKVYTIIGQQITSLEQFFEEEEIFIAYGPEKSTENDFELDFEESQSVQSFRKGPKVSKRQSELVPRMPRMPRKSRRKSSVTPRVRTPSPSTLILPESLRLQYSVGYVLGEGNFSVVRHCIHKATDAEYAMKIVDKSKCQGKETMLASEVSILRQVCHPNIISLISDHETPEQLFLVMEFVKGGDLFDAIAIATKFTEPEARLMIGHLVSALAYLHSHHIVHRDVKPENLLVEMDGSYVKCLKLGDFGLAQIVREPLYTVCGTPTYVAPEILAETGYGLKIDVWAAGVILYVLLCGFPPFVSPDNEQEELFECILTGQYEFTSPYWDPVSDSAKQLISNMLQAQPELRFSAEDVLDHPWLASFVGGDQTAATISADSSQQYWVQQRQPIRMATFEFDYKKQIRSNSVDKTYVMNNDKERKRNKWNHDLASKLTDFHFVADTEKEENIRYFDEVDFTNINHNKEEPVSLGAECLQDISSMSHSVNSMIINLNEQNCYELSQSETSSLNSIPENLNCTPTNQNTISIGSDSIQRSGSEIRRSRQNHSGIPVLLSTPRSNRKSIYSIVSQKITNRDSEDTITSEIQKSARSGNNRQSRLLKNDDKCKMNNDFKTFKNDDYTNLNIASSADSLTGESNNDIETSDSFVNIQFAQMLSSQRSDSTHSMESTDSFENVKFYRNDKMTDNNRIKNDIQTNRLNQFCNAKNQKFDTKMSQNRNDKITRDLNNSHLVKNKLNSSDKINGDDACTSLKGEFVKLRDKKFTPRNQQNLKTPTNNKYTSSRKEVKSAVLSDVRKCNSTDELRDKADEKPVKNKRFSLYYTPQPLRKNYEVDNNKAGKSMCKNISVNYNNRNGNEKSLDVNKKSGSHPTYRKSVGSSIISKIKFSK